MIYFIQEDGNKGRGAVKIGWTRASDVKARLCALQTGNPRKLTLVASFDGDDLTEAELHEHFRYQRCFGGSEWFRWSDEIAEMIKHGLAPWRARQTQQRAVNKAHDEALRESKMRCRACGVLSAFLVCGDLCGACDAAGVRYAVG